MLRWSILIALVACGSSSSRPGAPAGPSAPGPAAAPETVTLTTSDGVTLAATYVPGPSGSDRGVVFVHQKSSQRGEWGPFVEALRGKVHVLAIDMRGHGGSTRGPSGALSWKDFDDAEWEKTTADVDAATRYLADKGVPLGRCVVVGSSIGSSAALRFAGDHPELAGLVLLSPGLKYHGLETVPAARRYGKPKLVIYSNDALDAARGLEQAWRKEPGLPQPQPVTMRQVPGKAHGVKMLADDPGIVDAVVAFIETATR